MSVKLKIKMKSLGAEARFIRHEEKKACRGVHFLKDRQGHEATAASLRDIRASIYHHRVHVVRPEARASNLAYALLRGRKYKDVENTCHFEPDWARVTTLLTVFGGYGPNTAASAVKTWSEGGDIPAFEAAKAWENVATA